MIENGSTVVINTTDATYAPCEIVELGTKNVVVRFCSGTKTHKETGVAVPSFSTDVIRMDKIISMSERL